MKRYLHIIILIFTAVSFSSAARGQSIFSLNYIGEHRFRGDARSAALGFSALAVPDSNMAITMNMATLSGLSRITLSLYERVHMCNTEYQTEESRQSRFSFPSAVVAAPLADGLVFSVGYRTRFSGRADFSLEGEVIGNPDYSPASRPEEEYELDSSLYSVPFGLSWRINDRISIGGELQIERGSIRDGVTISFDNSNYGDSYSERKRIFSATSWAFSFLARPHSRFFIAGVVDGQIDYSVDEYIKHTRSEFNSNNSWDFTLPPAYSVGIAAGLSERWWLTSTFWQRSEPDAAGFSEFEGALGSERLFAVGLERQGNKKSSFRLSRMPIRVGYYENIWHMEIPAGEPVKSRFFTIGSGFGIPGGEGALNYAFEFGKIGSIESNAIEETVLRFSVSMGISEAWKKRVIVKH